MVSTMPILMLQVKAKKFHSKLKRIKQQNYISKHNNIYSTTKKHNLKCKITS